MEEIIFIVTLFIIALSGLYAVIKWWFKSDDDYIYRDNHTLNDFYTKKD